MELFFRERRTHLLQTMKADALDAIVVTSNPALRYLTGIAFPSGERLIALILSPQGISIVLPRMELERLPDDSDITALPYVLNEEMEAALQSALSAQRIAVEKEAITLRHAEQIACAAGISLARLENAAALLNTLRMYKDSYELEQLDEACRRTDRILERWQHEVHPGLTEQQLRQRLDAISLEEGVSEACPGILIASGINSSVPHGLDTPRCLQPGDPVYIDCGARWNGYYCDITRTFFLGEPEEEAKKVYQIVLEAQAAAIAAVRPGIPLKEVDLAARRVIEEAGYGEYFTHRTGHGLGLAVHEQPSAGRDVDMLMAPGMVITVEPGIYLPGRWGVRIEDDIVVEEHGARVLTAFPKQLEDMILPCP